MRTIRENRVEKYTAMAKLIADMYGVNWLDITANNRETLFYNVRLIIFRELQNMGVKNDMIAEILNRKENTLTAWGYDIYHKMKDKEFMKLYEIIKKKTDHERI